MATIFGTAIRGGVDRLVRWLIVPVAEMIPALVRTGVLFVIFAVLWFGFFAALGADPTTIDTVWRTIQGLPLVVQAIAWLLFLPLTAGLWIWSTEWTLVVRIVLVVGIAGWNLAMFLPRRETAAPAAAE